MKTRLLGPDGEPSMNLRHVALVCSSQENADRFFGTVLGLDKSEPKILPRALSKSLFDLDTKITIVNYLNDKVHFEIFIDPHRSGPMGAIEHVCLEVGDLIAFLQRCRDAGVSIIQVPKGDSLLTFVRDPDDHLFELKERAVR